ncbi:MFS transporter, ACDE family, multidrug resistance protein [Sediminibacillus albus]|uniref:MFS transporter, ACDE family, multidrug resistance protein n=2 Tax=Sediminibacillus albus TaxID=407036 RepID=A0A1G8VUB1_9BACI|nr:MFS transporter, ACDE family, multidrug resistance protein [Sediminibacillus albus]
MANKLKKGPAILAISSIPLIMTLGNSMLIPILPKMESELNINSFQASLTITIFSIAAALSIPVLGYLSDRFSRKSIILPALALYGLGGLLAGMASAWFDSAYLWILIGRALQGVGAAGTAPIAMALTGDLFKGGEQSKVLGLVEASNGFGKVLSPIVGSLLALIVWYGPFFGFPIFCVVSILLLLFFVKEKKKKQKPPTLGNYLKGLFTVFKHEGRWLFTAYLAGATGLFTLFGLLFYLSDVLETDYNITGVLKGCVLAIPLLFLMSTSFTTGSKIGKNHRAMKHLIVLGLLLMTASFASLIFFTKLIPFIAVLVVSSIGTGLVLPCLNSFITGSVGKARRGFVTSLYGSVRFLGVAAGPPVYGWLMNWSRNGMFLSTAGLTLLVAFLCLILIHVKKQDSDDKDDESHSLFKKLQLTAE